jgi:hypothetical protein
MVGLYDRLVNYRVTVPVGGFVGNTNRVKEREGATADRLRRRRNA